MIYSLQEKQLIFENDIMNEIFKSNDGKEITDKYQSFLRKQLTKEQK